MRLSQTKNQRHFHRVILILLIMLLSLSGCGAKYETGDFGYTNFPELIMFGARSETDEFPIDDVSFELYYGLFPADDSNPDGNYRMDGSKVVFVLYVCDGSNRYTITEDGYVDDIELEDHYLIKEIPEEEAFSEEYGYTVDYWSGTTYNHHETVSIPSGIFTRDEGKFVIKIMAFAEPENENEQYYVLRKGTIAFDYLKIDDDTVKIEFK